MKIAYIGIDLFYTALKTLHELGCDIIEVFTCEVDNKTEFNVKILEFAEKHNIPCQMTKIKKADIDRLVDKGCEAVICGGYYFKIPVDTRLFMVNIHPSLLPVGRGAWPMAQAILWGHKKSGVTIHKIAEGFDTGDILLQREFNLDRGDTHETFMEKANALLPDMIKSLIGSFDALYHLARPQGEGEYWKSPVESDYTITPNMTTEEADLILRAFYGYECVYAADGKKTIIVGGRAVKSDTISGKRFPLIDGYIKVDEK